MLSETKIQELLSEKQVKLDIAELYADSQISKLKIEIALLKQILEMEPDVPKTKNTEKN
jgi:hypothetical protein